MLLTLTDLSVLFIATHGAIQVYQPTVDPHDHRYGINSYRRHVFITLAVVPTLLSSLAFTDPKCGYVCTGIICWLPENPRWYRLTLAWVPRCIIILLVTGISISVYVHAYQQLNFFKMLWNPKPGNGGATQLDMELDVILPRMEPFGEPVRSQSQRRASLPTHAVRNIIHIPIRQHQSEGGTSLKSSVFRQQRMQSSHINRSKLHTFHDIKGKISRTGNDPTPPSRSSSLTDPTLPEQVRLLLPRVRNWALETISAIKVMPMSTRRRT
jgi:hypothetical protein